MLQFKKPERIIGGEAAWKIPHNSPEDFVKELPDDTLECANSPKTAELPDDTKLVKMLGEGAFGEVFQVFTYAVKRLKKNCPIITDNEINIIQSIECPFSVKYFGAFRYNDKPHIIMECMFDGTLAKLQEKAPDGIPESVLSQITCQILLFLNYLISHKKIMHRDLKPANIFINHDGSIKVGDYGLAKDLGTKNTTATFQGSPIYMSPERLREKPYGFSCDIWSLGMIVLELFSGESFTSQSQKLKNSIHWMSETTSEFNEAGEEHKKLVKNFQQLVLNLLEHNQVQQNYSDKTVSASQDLIDFVFACCKNDPEERAKAEQLLQFKFITKYNDMTRIEPLINCSNWSDKKPPFFKKVAEFMEEIEWITDAEKSNEFF